MKSSTKLFLAVGACALSLGGTVGCSSSSSTSTATDAGGGADAGTLYDRLGQNAGITTAISAIVKQELMDPEIASYFYYQGLTPIPAGHPTSAQIEACFVNLLANAAGGPEQYPGTPSDSAGFQCRSMVAAHATLGIPGPVFDKFVTIAAGVLMSAGVSAADIATIGGVLNGTRAQVAQDTTRDGGDFITPDGG